MSSFDWTGDTLTVKEPDVRDPKRDIVWEAHIKKNGGWWWYIFRNGEKYTSGANKSKQEARDAAEKILRDLMSAI